MQTKLKLSPEELKKFIAKYKMLTTMINKLCREINNTDDSKTINLKVKTIARHNDRLYALLSLLEYDIEDNVIDEK